MPLRLPFPVAGFALVALGLCSPGSASRAQMLDGAEAFRYVLPLDGRYLNDHSIIWGPDSLWHLFGIVGTISQERWDRDGNEVMIGHFTSPDLRRWEEHAPAITTGPEGSYDDAHVYAPSVIYRGGTFYMYYTATDSSHPSPERICLATSHDLTTWEKSPENPVFRPDSSWAAYYPQSRPGGSGPMSCRDPHVMQHAQYGFIMYYAARLRRGENGEDLACIGAATSYDLLSWEDRGPVLVREVFGEEEHVWSHPESPTVFNYLGRYYLFWKGGNGTHYTMSRDPLDFRHTNSYFLSTSHASEIVNWDGEWYITSCSRDPDDPNHDTDRRRGLYLAGLRWEDRWPSLFALDVSTVPVLPILKNLNLR